VETQQEQCTSVVTAKISSKNMHCAKIDKMCMSLELCRLTMHSVTAELHVDYKLTLVAEINQSVYYYEAWHRLFVSALDAAVQGNKG